MNSDFLELGLETFHHLTDKYYDHVHDGVGKVGPWLRDQRARSHSRSRPKDPNENQASMPSSPAEDYPPHSPRRSRYDDNDYDERRGQGSGRRRRNVERDSPDWDERSSRGNRDREIRDNRPPQIRIDSAPLPSRPGSHIYPPAPQPMAPPYPTTAGALIPMPPDAPYPPLSRSASERGRHLGVARPPMGRARSTGYYDDDYWDRDGERRPRSNSHGRRSRGHHRREDERKKRDLHLGVSLAGAVAGGVLGQKASKGDWKATMAGAVVGALGANVAEREWERHKRRDNKEEEDWEQKWGRR